MLLVACSLYSCAVERPDVQLCIVNAPSAARKCYNMKTDYNDDGTLKAGAQPVYKQNRDVTELNKAMVVDSATGFEDGLAKLKSYIKKLREHYQNCGSATKDENL